MDTSSQLKQELVHSGLAFQLRFNGTSSSHLPNLPQVGDRLLLVPEPENQFDPRAVAIRNQDGFIGYVNPVQSQGLSEYLQNGKLYYAQLKLVGELSDTHNLQYGIMVYTLAMVSGCKEVLRVPTRG